MHDEIVLTKPVVVAHMANLRHKIFPLNVNKEELAVLPTPDCREGQGIFIIRFSHKTAPTQQRPVKFSRSNRIIHPATSFSPRGNLKKVIKRERGCFAVSPFFFLF